LHFRYIVAFTDPYHFLQLPTMTPPPPSSSQRFNTRLGLYLFAFYSLVYLGFALTSAFSPALSRWQPLGGVNLATWWGLGLIGLAFVMAMIYGFLCRNDPTEPHRLPSTKEQVK
jgi:uncharacterized membrane protein (DUF485 family)